VSERDRVDPHQLVGRRDDIDADTAAIGREGRGDDAELDALSGPAGPIRFDYLVAAPPPHNRPFTATSGSMGTWTASPAVFESMLATVLASAARAQVCTPTSMRCTRRCVLMQKSRASTAVPGCSAW
jgi:hypothetical protein